MEIWKAIPGYEGIYEASSLGRIRTAEGKTTHSVRHGVRHWQQRILHQKWQRRGRKHDGSHADAKVSLWKDKQMRTLLVARLVCSSFHGEPFEGATVNHINGDPSDNRAENLEWLSSADNIHHGLATGLYSSMQKPVCLVDERGNKTAFPSMNEADRYLGRSTGYVSNAVIRGHRISSALTGEWYCVEAGRPF